MGRRLTSALIGLVLVVSACSSSSSDSGEATADAESPTTSSAATDSASTDTAAPAESATTTAAAAAAASSGGSGTATVTLDNGESYSFSVICSLEPQVAAASEILFTAVSNDEPFGFDVTQFGQLGAETGGVLDGIGGVTIWDSATYDDVWAADSVMAQLDGSDFTLELSGSTITGSGMFVEGGDIEKLDSAVRGDLIVECG